MVRVCGSRVWRGRLGVLTEGVSVFRSWQLHDGPPHHSNQGYAFAKRMIDTLNRCYKDQYGCNFTSVVPCNVYGKHDNFNVVKGHVIPGLVHKCYLAKQNNEDFVIWGSGAPLRQFIYNEDLGELIVWIMRNYNSVEPVILSVGAEEECSIKDVAMGVAEAMKFQGRVVVRVVARCCALR